MILTLQAYRRPEYLAQVLQALGRCEGIENYRLLIDVEPGDERVTELIKGISFCQTEVFWHDHLYGPNRAAFESLTRPTEYFVHIEDDHVLSPDALEWFRFFEDSDVFDVGSFNLYSYDLPYMYARRGPIASGGAWAIWPDRLEGLRFRDRIPWDTQLVWYARGGLEIYPLLSRTQNIGRENGTFIPPEYHGWYQHATDVARCRAGFYQELGCADARNPEGLPASE